MSNEKLFWIPSPFSWLIYERVPFRASFNHNALDNMQNLYQNIIFCTSRETMRHRKITAIDGRAVNQMTDQSRPAKRYYDTLKWLLNTPILGSVMQARTYLSYCDMLAKQYDRVIRRFVQAAPLSPKFITANANQSWRYIHGLYQMLDFFLRHYRVCWRTLDVFAWMHMWCRHMRILASNLFCWHGECRCTSHAE